MVVEPYEKGGGMYKKCGFTLIELAISIVIVGLLMGGIFRYLDIQQTKKRADVSNERVNNNTSLLSQFASNFDGPDAGNAPDQRLPCPSNPNLYIGQAGFGVEHCPPITAAAGTIFNGVEVAVNPVTGGRVFIGGFPSATMGTKGDDTFDGYSQKIIYAVSANLTVNGTVTSQNPAGDIVVNVDGGGVKNDAPFAIVSIGKNGDVGAGSAATGDGENLNNDHIFNAFAGHSTAISNTYYDDEVAFQLGKVTDCTPSKLDVQEFSVPGTYTWTKPAGFQYAVIEVRGADGGAGSCRSGQNMCGGTTTCTVQSGGYGGYGKTLVSDSNIGSTAPIVVGTGGTAGCATALGSSCIGVASMPLPGNRQTGFITAGRNASVTSFGPMVIQGGQGATLTSPAASVQGLPGTGTGFDFYSTTPGLIPLNGNGFIPITTTTTSSSNSSCGGSSWTQALKYGGKGSDGYVLVTSYVCQ